MKRRSILYFPLHHSVSSIKDHKSFYTGITLQPNLQRSTTLIIKKWSPSFNVYHNFIALQKHMFWFSPQAQYKHVWEIRSLFLIKCSKFQLSVYNISKLTKLTFRVQKSMSDCFVNSLLFIFPQYNECLGKDHFTKH